MCFLRFSALLVVVKRRSPRNENTGRQNPWPVAAAAAAAAAAATAAAAAAAGAAAATAGSEPTNPLGLTVN
jgi:hypothetical protein